MKLIFWIRFLVLALLIPTFGFSTSLLDGMGVNVHLFRGTWVFQDINYQKIWEAGIRTLRIEVSWEITETSRGVYDFSRYLPAIQKVKEFGFHPYFVMTYANPNYPGSYPPTTLEHQQAFADWAGEAVRYFRANGIIDSRWEIYNEPNGNFWKPRPDAQIYTRLVQLASAKIKGVSLNELVAGPALGGMDFPFLETCFKAGMLSSIDIVSVHPYHYITPPEYNGSLYRKAIDLIRKYQPYGKNISLISSEYGASDIWFKNDPLGNPTFSSDPAVLEDLQAQFVPRHYLSNFMNGIQESHWYDWVNDVEIPAEEERHFGLVREDGPAFVPKPAYTSYQMLTSFLGDYRFIKRIYLDNPDDFVLLFSDGSNQRLAVWTASPAHGVTLPFNTGHFSVMSYDGRLRPSLSAGSNGLPVTLSGKVQYLFPTAPNALLAASALENVYAAGNLVLQPRSDNQPNIHLGRVNLRFQADGNLVVWDPIAGKALWNAGVYFPECLTQACNLLFAFQGDGNIVLTKNGQPYWSSHIADPLGRAHSLVLSDESPYLKIINETGSFVWMNSPFTLNAGQSIQSSSTTVSLTMQTDGNLVYSKFGQPLWSTKTWGRNCGPTNSSNCAAVFQIDGNFVLYQRGIPFWATNWLGQKLPLTGSRTLVVSNQLPYLRILDDSQRWTWASSPDAGTYSIDRFTLLHEGESIDSVVGTTRMVLVMQSDGNLVLYRNGKAVWSTQTWGRSCNGDCFAAFQTDGNLALYQGWTHGYYGLFNGKTPPGSGAHLVLSERQPYLRVVDFKGKTVWTSGLAVYRAFNPRNLLHTFTTDVAEYNLLIDHYKLSPEGLSFYVPVDGSAGAVPFFRLYNPATSQHYFTTGTGDRDALVRQGWKAEGSPGHIYLEGNQPDRLEVFHLYNKRSGDHLYTVYPEEAASILRLSRAWEKHRSLGFVDTN